MNNNSRRMLFFFLAICLITTLSGTSKVSAVDSGFLFSINHISPSATDNITLGVITTDNTLTISFNLTNLTGNDENENTDGFNLTNNMTISLIMPNGTEVEVARNFTDVATFFTNLHSGTGASAGAGQLDFEFNFGVFLNNTVVPPDSEGNFLANITFDVLNVTGNINGSVTLTGLLMTIDAAPPDVTLVTNDKQGKSQTRFEATDSVKIVCSRSAAIANYNYTNISITTPSVNVYALLTDDVTRSLTNNDLSFTFTQTASLGDYNVECDSVDDYGLVNSTVNASFTVVKKPPKSVSAFKNKAFVAPEGKTIVTDTEDLGKIPAGAKGVSRQLKTGASLKVDVKGEQHSITLKTLTPTEITLSIKSTPQEVTIPKNQTKEVDIDGDGINDVAITFHQQVKSGTSATADITLRAVSTPSEATKEANKQPSTTTNEGNAVAGSFAGGAIVTIIVIIAVIIIGFALIRGKKK